jgi:hypothetical protein
MANSALPSWKGFPAASLPLEPASYSANSPTLLFSPSFLQNPRSPSQPSPIQRPSSRWQLPRSKPYDRPFRSRPTPHQINRYIPGDP